MNGNTKVEPDMFAVRFQSLQISAGRCRSTLTLASDDQTHDVIFIDTKTVLGLPAVEAVMVNKWFGLTRKGGNDMDHDRGLKT